jgi:hypothetical protein
MRVENPVDVFKRDEIRIREGLDVLPSRWLDRAKHRLSERTRQPLRHTNPQPVCGLLEIREGLFLKHLTLRDQTLPPVQVTSVLPYGLFRKGEHIALEDHNGDSSAPAGI